MAVVYILQMYKYFSLVKICRRQMLRGSEGKFRTFFRENRAFVSNCYEKLGIFWRFGVTS